MNRAALSSVFFAFLLLITVSDSGAAEPFTLTVEKGDTLYSIGREYDVSVKKLLEVNGIVNPRRLKEGMRITVPHTYVIERGDTLYSLAREHDTSVEALCSYNGIDPDEVLKVGTVLSLPREVQEAQESELRAAEESSSTESPDPGSQNGELSDTEDTEESGKTVREEQKKQEAQGTTVRPARYEKGDKPEWPHGGERAELTGKLKGTQISGTKGDNIVAVASGRVVWVAPYRGYGKLVMVEAENGMIYAYGGNEEIYVDVGDRVQAGTVLGSLGINPVEKNAKAFFFVYKDGRPIDPEKAPRG